MDEAERCRNLAVISRGVLLAHDTPDNVRSHFKVQNLEEVFIELQERSGELV
jgi:ABC-type multidrug transport system ATPase subunit